MFSMLVDPATSLETLSEIHPRGVILSGGPSSIYDQDAPMTDKTVLDLKVPILGICLGFQGIGAFFGAEISKAREPKHGKTALVYHDATPLFDSIPDPGVSVESSWFPVG